MKNIVVGILAHVDAGKTTLSEALLFNSGTIRSLGRVDSKNTFLDNYFLEKDRGITIFSKQALLQNGITLIDTPGHIDFACEMERALNVMDCAILLINALDGVQSHTKTLWSLLQQYKIPTLIFVNKMDMAQNSKDVILQNLRNVFCAEILNFENMDDNFFEDVASCDEKLLEKYINQNTISNEEIKKIVMQQKVFPCIFGSALKLQNIQKLVDTLATFFSSKNTLNDFAAYVYKISRDKQNNRLTHLKILGGSLKAKENFFDEKINEIRIYSGDKFESVKEVFAGELCTVTGLKSSKAGMVYGDAEKIIPFNFESVLMYSVIPPKEIDSTKLLDILRELEDEMPEIKVEYMDQTKEVCIRLMGEVQTQVIKELIKQKYQIEISFGEGRIAYKETIKKTVVGIGHYEPLRHYAEVQLQLSPLPIGSGLKFITDLRVDELDTNWQRLILTHLKEKNHIGVLTGSPITDIEIRLLAGKAHLKHTEGGDFRQATYRAIRHGLMKSESVLLEPFYKYQVTVPENCMGRVMSDFERMHGSCFLKNNISGFVTLEGRVPVATSKNYANDLRIFSKGQGVISFVIDGYDVCHNELEVIQNIGYDANQDSENPAFSVFCSHGSGFAVPWEQVDNYKHIKL